MTNNKFWLVCRNIDFDETLNTKEEAIKKARHACEVNFESNVYILEATHHFKTDVTETSFEATPEELKLIPKTEYRKKFNNGDLVKIEHSDDAFKIISCGGSFTKEYTGNVYDIESIKDGKIYRSINECDLMPEESSAVEPKFKIGDRVLLDNYYECVVDDYFDETKSYKLSIISGGYNIANETRITKK